MQLRGCSLRGLGAPRAGELLPLQTMSAAEWRCGLGAGTSRSRNVPSRRRRTGPPHVEAARRWRKVVLRRMRISDLRIQPQSPRIRWHPDGDIRRRSGSPSFRSAVRCLRRQLGTAARRRLAAIPRQPTRRRDRLVTLWSDDEVSPHVQRHLVMVLRLAQPLQAGSIVARCCPLSRRRPRRAT
ncbi:MAG: hypothetical protein QOH23_2251 [Gaiellaceae bacterium]|nr:hypothetical protein [Gaiellaceae bacterium]